MKRLIWILLACPHIAFAEAPQARLEHERVTVSIRQTTTRTGGAASVSASGDALIGLGERAGVIVAASPGLCAAVGGGGRGQTLDQFTLQEFVEHFWWADMELLDSGLEDLRLKVDWQRHDRREGKLVRTKGGTRTITLREGENHLLDFVPEPETDRGQVCYENLLVDLTAAIHEDPELENEELRYELWFVDEDSSGTMKTARFEASGKQGEKLDFRFESQRWLIAKGVLEGGADAELALDILGALRGRLRRDGSITVELDATRWLGVAPEGQPRGGGIGDGGRKVFAVTPGETVKMILPKFGEAGSHSLRRAPGRGSLTVAPDRGIVLDEKSIRAHHAVFLEGHEMAVLLTVTLPH